MKPVDIDGSVRKQALEVFQELIKMSAEDPSRAEMLKQLIQLLDLPLPAKIYQIENLFEQVIALRDQKLSFEQLREIIKDAMNQDLDPDQD